MADIARGEGVESLVRKEEVEAAVGGEGVADSFPGFVPFGAVDGLSFVGKNFFHGFVKGREAFLLKEGEVLRELALEGMEKGGAVPGAVGDEFEGGGGLVDVGELFFFHVHIDAYASDDKDVVFVKNGFAEGAGDFAVVEADVVGPFQGGGKLFLLEYLGEAEGEDLGEGFDRRCFEGEGKGKACVDVHAAG